MEKIVISCLFSAIIFFSGVVKSEMDNSFKMKILELEKKHSGRIGISAVDTSSGYTLGNRENETFPTQCTSKVIGVATILKKVDEGKATLSKKIFFKKEDLAEWSPLSKNYVGRGMEIDKLAEAAIIQSDNTAMNFLVKEMGGLNEMNLFARSIGDQSFTQTHDWPKEAYSGGPNNRDDSSTPKAMQESLRKIVLGNALSEKSKSLISQWMKKTSTGMKRIRAGVPKTWVVGDKTGTGAVYGTTNDVAVVWPPKCAPLVIVIYSTYDQEKNAKKNEALVASVTSIVIDEFAKKNKCLKIN